MGCAASQEGTLPSRQGPLGATPPVCRLPLGTQSPLLGRPPCTPSTPFVCPRTPSAHHWPTARMRPLTRGETAVLLQMHVQASFFLLEMSPSRRVSTSVVEHGDRWEARASVSEQRWLCSMTANAEL